MKAILLKNVKFGQYFTFQPIEEPTEKQVYIRSRYDRSTKRYAYIKWSDINAEKFAKGEKIAYIDFSF